MNWQTLVDAQTLAPHLADADLRLFDCRFDLADPGAGQRAYAAAHLPSAAYLDLDHDLSDHARHGHGRHPWPCAEVFCARLGALGVRRDDQVVLYDAGDGSMAAARAWALLHLLGHRRVAVLDGGLRHWQRLGLALTEACSAHMPSTYTAQFDSARLCSSAQVLARLHERPGWLIDARAEARFRGEVEPLDPVAGHVPGALNRPFSANLDADGRWRPASELRAQFSALAPERRAGWVVMCGSGVTACHHLLAMTHAGMGDVGLYADSWSGWISDPSRPVARG